MPIYPSVITGTVAHKHEASSATGGPLAFTGDTLSGLTNGSMTFANGGAGALQELNIGSTGAGLRVAGGLPVWGASSTSILGATGDMLYASGPNVPAALNIGTAGQVLGVNSLGTLPEWITGGKLSLLEHYEELAATGNTHTFLFSPALDLTDNFSKIILISSYFGLAGQLYATINNITTGIYAQGGLTVDGGVSGTVNTTYQNQLSIQHDTTVGDTKQSELTIMGNSADGRLNGFWKEYSSLTHYENGGFYMGSNQSGLVSSIELTTSANTWDLGSTFDVYSYKL